MRLTHLLMYLIMSCLGLNLIFSSELKKACNRDILALLYNANGGCCCFDIHQSIFLLPTFAFSLNVV